MQSTDRTFEAFYQNQAIDDLEKRTINGTYIYFAAWMLIGIGAGYHQDKALFFWLIAGIFFILGVIRLTLYFYVRKRHSENIILRKRLLAICVILPALLYAFLLSIAIYFPAFDAIFIYIVLTMFALLSAGTTGFSPSKTLSISFVFCLTTLPMITAIFLTNNRIIEGLMLALYSVYMLVQALRINKEYRLRIQQQHRLNQINQEDSLTGIFNRRGFDTALENLWLNGLRSKTHLTLFIIDIDYFKLINDKYGHSAGDEVIISIANSIKESCKRNTDMVARIGGEEFAVLFSTDKPESVSNFAELIRQAIEQNALNIQSNTIRATASIGVAITVPENEKNARQFFDIADKCLYQAKESGRNRVVVESY